MILKKLILIFKIIFIFLFILLIGPVLYILFHYNSMSVGSYMTASRADVDGRIDKNYQNKAMVMVFSARTFGRRGAFGEHPWIAYKSADQDEFTIAQVIGWLIRSRGNVVSKTTGYPDVHWYGNKPDILYKLEGEAAAKLIPSIETAVDTYPYSGMYKVWPGPNSNTFINHIREQVPGLDFPMSPLSVGSYHNKWFYWDENRNELTLSLGGYFGLELGSLPGLRLHILGLVFGFDPMRFRFFIPGFGAVG